MWIFGWGADDEDGEETVWEDAQGIAGESAAVKRCRSERYFVTESFGTWYIIDSNEGIK